MHGNEPARFQGWLDLGRQMELHSEAIIGAAGEVHALLGPGYEKPVYEEAMCDELLLRGVPFIRNAVLAVQYKGRRIGNQELDLLVGDGVIVDVLSVDGLEPMHTAKMQSWLKASHLFMGLLINFNVPQLTYGIKRIRPQAA